MLYKVIAQHVDTTEQNSIVEVVIGKQKDRTRIVRILPYSALVDGLMAEDRFWAHIQNVHTLHCQWRGGEKDPDHRKDAVLMLSNGWHTIFVAVADRQFADDGMKDALAYLVLSKSTHGDAQIDRIMTRTVFYGLMPEGFERDIKNGFVQTKDIMNMQLAADRPKKGKGILSIFR